MEKGGRPAGWRCLPPPDPYFTAYSTSSVVDDMVAAPVDFETLFTRWPGTSSHIQDFAVVLMPPVSVSISVQVHFSFLPATSISSEPVFGLGPSAAFPPSGALSGNLLVLLLVKPVMAISVSTTASSAVRSTSVWVIVISDFVPAVSLTVLSFAKEPFLKLAHMCLGADDLGASAFAATADVDAASPEAGLAVDDVSV